MEKIFIDGSVGRIEVALDIPAHPARGLALVAHPHPLFGGTLDNKVVQTLARTLMQLGYLAARPNFRGVGETQGTHDAGTGETEDLLTVIEFLQRSYGLQELVLAGFSFGSFVQSHVAQALAQQAIAVKRMVLVGTAVDRWSVAPVPADTIVIHGERDETVPLAALFDWARPQNLPVIVIPGADHFFHGKLMLIKRLVLEAFGSLQQNPNAS